MIRNFQESKVVEQTEYNLLFYADATGGLSFPCDKDGNITTKYPAALANYEHAIRHPEAFPYAFREIAKRTHRYREPASGICHCGKRIDLYNQYLGACQCPYCGQWWNLFGQELNDVFTWEKGEDW